LTAIANFVTILSKLTSLANYFFQKICIKSALSLTTYFGAIFTTEDMLSALVFLQTTDIDKVTRRNFLSFQAVAILNSTLLDNLSMYNQPNTQAL